MARRESEFKAREDMGNFYAACAMLYIDHLVSHKINGAGSCDLLAQDVVVCPRI